MERKDLSYYLHLEYPTIIRKMPDGMYCAEIPLLKGCAAYGKTADEALYELEGVKETVLEILLEKGEPIPEPTVRLEIPVSVFEQLEIKEELAAYVQ
jgi:predicted RNase H-like HicB family nuclease